MVIEPEPELGVGRIGDVPFGVGQSVGFAKQRLAVPRQQGRALEPLLVDVSLNELVGLAGDILGRRAGSQQENQR